MLKLNGLLLILRCCSFCGHISAITLNLTERCADRQIFYCTLTGVNVTLEDPLTVVVNASAPQLQELVLRNSLIPRVPSDVFQQLPQLRAFVMHKCGLQRLNANDFLRAQHLRTLVLQHNRLSEVPEKMFATIFKLEELLLGHNTMHMIHHSAFTGLKRLRYLDLQQNDINMLLEGLLADLINLEHIDLSGNALEVIDNKSFAANLRLQTVLLSNNKFKFFEANALNHLPHLHLLDISNSTLEELNVLSVDTLLVWGSALKRCVIAGSAIKVYASYNQLASISVGDKCAVRDLDLHGNALTTLDDLVGMLNLQRLDVSANKLTTLSTSHSPLYLPLPSLTTLNLANNQLHNLSAVDFLLLQKLTHLDLAFNHHLQLEAHMFEPLYNLEQLFVEGIRLHKFDYKQLLRSHKHIKELGLSGNDLGFHELFEILQFMQKHGVQRSIRFSKHYERSLHAVTPASSRFHHHPDIEPPQISKETKDNVNDNNSTWKPLNICVLFVIMLIIVVMVGLFCRLLMEDWCWQTVNSATIIAETRGERLVTELEDVEAESEL